MKHPGITEAKELNSRNRESHTNLSSLLGPVSSLQLSLPSMEWGSETGTERVIRGGAFFHPASQMRSAHRTHMQPETRDVNASGFRIVLESIE